MKTNTPNFPSEMIEHNKINLTIGGYTLHPLPTGLFALDGGAMFGSVPKVIWQKTNPTDELNRIQMEARALLLKSKDRCIVIDTGNGSDFIAKYGEKLGPQFAKMYAIDQNGPSLLKSLEKYQVKPEDVTDVILTHLHFDHAGGSTTEIEKKLKPTFPKARYHLQKSNLLTAQTPNRRERASYFKANFEPLIEYNCLQLIDGDQHDYLPHISVVVSNGHTQGHQMVKIADETQQLIYCGDVIPTSTHIRLAWGMGYDLNPLLLMEEKEKLLESVLNKKTYLFFEHDPYCDLATIAQDKQDFKVVERFWLV